MSFETWHQTIGQYFRKRERKTLWIESLKPGMFIDVEGDPTDYELQFLRFVPDPDHQSSLDYLAGV